MTDVREAILARLVVVVSGIPGIKVAYRNNVDIPPDQYPAVAVLDGDEDVVSGNDGSRPSNRPLLVEMTPEIVIVESSPGQVGSDLTAMRQELIKRVLFDAELIASTGSNGKISYLGCRTTLGWMRSMHGALLAMFMFKYALKPDDL